MDGKGTSEGNEWPKRCGPVAAQPLPGGSADDDFREYSVCLISAHENVHDPKSFDSCAASALGLDWREFPGCNA